MSLKTTSEQQEPAASPIVGRLQRQPRLVYGLMLLALFGSILGNFLQAGRRPEECTPLRVQTRVHQSYDDITRGLASMGELIQLRSKVSDLMATDSLGHTDSLRLLDACIRLRALNKQLNPIKK